MTLRLLRIALGLAVALASVASTARVAVAAPTDTTSTTGVHVVQVPGLFAGTAYGINGAGWVVGEAQFSSAPTTQAFLWKGTGSTIPVITPDPGVVEDSGARDVNDSGEVVGWFDNPVTAAKGAFRWTGSGPFEDLGIVPGAFAGGDIQAVTVDNHGNVVGTYLAAAGSCGLPSGSTGGVCSFYARPGDTGAAIGSIGVVDDGTSTGAKFIATDITLYDGIDGIVTGVAGGHGYSWVGFDKRPNAFEPFNDAGALHGVSSALDYVGSVNVDGETHAATWDTDNTSPTQVLPTLGGTFSTGLAINADGWVVGSSETAGGQTHAFLWKPDGTLNGEMTDLGTLGGASSDAFDISDQGLIVGRAKDADTGLWHAVVWDVAGTFDPDLPPEIAPIPPQPVAEGQLLTITSTVTDPDGDALTVTWNDLPAGAVQSGDSLVWTPGEADGPGIYTPTVTATENAHPTVSTSLTVQIYVQEVNQPPVLDAIGGKTATVGEELTFTATATDPDLPAQELVYQLEGGTFASPTAPPAGASIDAATGQFSWTPTAEGDYAVVVIVQDLVPPINLPGASDYEELTISVGPAGPANNPPTADAGPDQSATVGDAVTLDGSGSSDPDADALSYAWSFLAAPTGSTASLTGNATVSPTFTPDAAGDYTVELTVDDGHGGTDSDTVVITAAEPPTIVTITISEGIGVADQVTVAPAVQISLSEGIGVADGVDVSIQATTVDRGALLDQYGDDAQEVTVDGTYTFSGAGFDPDSTVIVEIRSDPIQITTTTAGGSGAFEVSVTIPQLLAGTHTLAAVGTGDGHPHEVQVEVTVLSPAVVTLDTENPVAIPVTAPGGDSEPFDLAFTATERYPGLVDGGLDTASVATELEPVGPGGSVAADSCSASVDGSLSVICHFSDVPVGTYAVVGSVGGAYIGSDEDVVVVYDPSLGFTTGGGWFLWPGTNDRTTFGYTMKYNKKGTNLQGNLLLIRHLPDGTRYRLKSNALDGLALSAPDAEFGWASFSGKATYQEPGWAEPQGNYRFVVYVEDHGTPGGGVDRFWINVTDDAGQPTDLSMPGAATTDAALLEGGDISVPHTVGRGRQH